MIVSAGRQAEDAHKSAIAARLHTSKRSLPLNVMPSTTRARRDDGPNDPIENPEEPAAMRVVDLRAELHAAGVDHSGRKAELVQRVEALRLLSPRTAAAAPVRAARGTKRVRLNMEPTSEQASEGADGGTSEQTSEGADGGATVDLASGQTATRDEGAPGPPQGLLPNSIW